ncbi:hypothetical protein ANO14919_121860 [Xylariales sp. No.14919]|nr:hypothetical protein ANO14919_121860 [Xylariales sp. No.14919]
MAHGGGGKPRSAQPAIKCNVMDVVESNGTEQAPLSNQCYPSDTSTIVLEPEQKAEYKCRWIHLPYKYAKFDEFLMILEQTLRTWDSEERTRIMTALRKLKHHNELRGKNGPNFRPGVFPLFGNEWHENLFPCLEQTELNSNQPLLVVIPTLHVGAPWFRSRQKPGGEDWAEVHFSKSLLEYHYRFNGGLTDTSGAEELATPTPANVRELWCVVVDKKNIITASNLAAHVIWPIANDLPATSVPSSFGHTFWENPPFGVDDLGQIFQPLERDAWRRILLVIIGMIGFITSYLIPGVGWLMYKYTDFVTDKLCGCEFSKLLRLYSFAYITKRATEDPDSKKLKSAEKGLYYMTGFGMSKITASDLELCSLREGVREWTRTEAAIRHRMHEEGPSEEVFAILKRLWAIAIVFSLNFFLDSKGGIHSLEPRKINFRRWFSRKPRKAKEKQQGEAKDSVALDTPITCHPRKPGETLRDLEEDLSKTLADLRRQIQSGIDGVDSENGDDRENRRLLEEIEKSGSNASLFCLLRVCILSTPSRFPSLNNLVVDFYAKKISRLEWLIRDQVTQSLVYQLSRLADELRIMRDIVISQREVVTKIAERFSDALSVDRAPAHEELDPKATPGSTNKNEDAAGSDRAQKSSRAANTLQTKVRIKHETLLVDLEKLEDTAERLKRQAALLLDIRTEGQNTAIFVFTVVTVIFLPLSFVTSYFGMNTSDIRDLEQGQWIFWAVGITLTVAILIILWLIAAKGRGWRTNRQASRFYGFEG